MKITAVWSLHLGQVIAVYFDVMCAGGGGRGGALSSGPRGRPGLLEEGISPGFFHPVFPSRSASVRLPPNTAKIGEKLEQYHTAIQVCVGGAFPEGGVCA
jgi:hypothetical protein